MLKLLIPSAATTAISCKNSALILAVLIFLAVFHKSSSFKLTLELASNQGKSTLTKISLVIFMGHSLVVSIRPTYVHVVFL